MKRLALTMSSFLSTLCVTLPACHGQDNPSVTLEIAVQMSTPSSCSSVSPMPIRPMPITGSLSVRNQLVTAACKGRIIAVNGHRAAGTWTGTHPTEAIWSVPVVWTFELSGLDHAHAGTIVAMRSTAGARATSDFTIVSGTGAYAGVTGTVSQGNVTKLETTARGEVIAQTFCADLTPAVLPSIAAVPAGPAVTHADGSLVSAGQPAAAGEVLTVYVTNLLPPSGDSAGGPLPVSVLVGQEVARVLYAGEYPGSGNGYQVNFQVPEGTASGLANLQILSGFMPSAAVPLSVQ